MCRHGIVQYPTIAFLYDSASPSPNIEDLDGTVAYAINDAGVIAGNTLTGAFVLDGNNRRAWYEQGAYGISETGRVSGNQAGRNPYRTTSIPYNPAVYVGGKWDVMDINDCNTVVGSSDTAADSLSHAFIWNAECNGLDAAGMEDLNGKVDKPDNWVLTSATAINERGDIVGTAQVTTDSRAENHGFLLSADGTAPPPPITPNQAPEAIAYADRTSGKAPLTVNFTGDESTDPEGHTLSYYWDFGDGKSSTEANPTNTYERSGTYVAVLTLTDAYDLTATTSLDIRVRGKKIMVPSGW